jgi:hypothetical protein
MARKARERPLNSRPIGVVLLNGQILSVALAGLPPAGDADRTSKPCP